MASEPKDMILPMLREMREENAGLHRDTQKRLSLMDKRIAKMEDTLGSFRQALTADSLLSKLVTGEFEERIEALETKMRKLEKHK